MSSNVYTKNQMLKELSDKGFFIDSYTLDTFFKTNKVDALFENEQGEELFDSSSLDLVVKKLFSNQSEAKTEDKEPIAAVPVSKTQEPVITVAALENEVLAKNIETPKKDSLKLPELSSDKEVMSTLNKITLSDGSLLTLEVEKELQREPKKQDVENNNEAQPQKELETVESVLTLEEQQIEAQEQKNKPQIPDLAQQMHEEHSQEDSDIDDLTLLSESFEAQEKFRDYIVNELTKKNFDMTPAQKVDYSQKMLDDISKAIAKKITKQVSEFCSNDAMFSAQLTELKEKIARLEMKNKELEKQNKKLRLLLTETNKNLNSYKPSLFGLYKKMPSRKK